MDFDKPCPIDDPDHEVRCEEALAPALNCLADRAVELAGAKRLSPRR